MPSDVVSGACAELSDPTWLTQRAAIELIRYAVDSVCEGTSWFFRRPAKIDRVFARRATSPQFARALADKLASLFDLDVPAIMRCSAISELAQGLIRVDLYQPAFALRIFGAMSVAFDFALRRRLNAKLEWLDPWRAWKYFLPTPTSARDEDCVVMYAQLSGASAFALANEMPGDSPVLILDSLRRIAFLLEMHIGELDEAFRTGGIAGLVRAFDNRGFPDNVRPHNPDIARAAIVYVVSGQCCWGKSWQSGG